MLYYLIHSYLDFEVIWQIHVISDFTIIWMILMMVGLIEINFKVTKGRTKLLEIKARIDK